MTTLRQWVALAGVAIVAVVAAGWFLLVAPKHAEAGDTRAQAAEQVQATSRLRTQLSVLKAQAANLPAEQAKLAAVATKLPADPAEPQLLRSLASVADAAGVEFVSITPGSPAPVSASPSTSAPSSGAASTGTPVGTTAKPTTGGVTTPATGTATASSVGSLLAMPITINTSGGYYQIEEYVAALEDLPRAVRITGLTLVNGANPVGVSQGSSTDGIDGQHLTATITAQVYIDSGAAPETAVAVPSTATGN